MMHQGDGIAGVIEKALRALRRVSPDDRYELARIFARLEQVAEALQEADSEAAEFAASLAGAAERVVEGDGETSGGALSVLSAGVEALQRFYAGQSPSPGDPALLQDLLALGDGGADAGEEDELQSAGPALQEVPAPEEAEALPDRDGEDESAGPQEPPAADLLEAEEADGAVEPGEAEASVEAEPFFEADEHAEPEDLPEAEAPSAEDAADGQADGSSCLEGIALEIMTVDLADLSGLGQVLGGLESLATDFRSERPLSATLAEMLARVVEQVIMDECEGAEDPVGMVADGVAMLQRMERLALRGEPEAIDDPALAERIAEVSGLSPGGLSAPAEAAPEAEDPAPAPPPAAAAVQVDTSIFFDFVTEAEEHLEHAETHLLTLDSNPEDRETINAVFRAFHTIKGASGFLNLQDVTRVAHAVEDVLDSGRKGTLQLTPSILDVALESVDLLRQLIAGAHAQLEDGPDVVPQDVSAFLARVAQSVDPNAPAPASESAAGPPETPGPGGNGAPPPVQVAEEKRPDQNYVRVGTGKLDQLVNLVGELVIAQTQVSQNPEILKSSNQKLTKDISQLVKISNDIQEIAMSMRMVPIRGAFERMARIVRDLARKCGKKVHFETVGEETELDKNVVEELVDPLTHMVRNAVDHGVESAPERLAAGKDEAGTVSLSAYHKGGNIVIELKDDGKGLDRERLLQKGIERGLVRPGAEPSADEIYDLVFHPGLSTAEQVSDISGRGVGMDVVRRNIEELRGKVEVESEWGKGSRFLIRLPLTLAIIDGMVIGVGENRYILPLTSIVRSLRPRPDEVATVLGKGELVRVQEDLLPLVRLHERFDVVPRFSTPSEGLVVVVEAEGGRCCLLVDELLGMQQVVIKGLNDDLRNDPCLSGCAILGDGHVGLILDANGIVAEAGREAECAVYR